MALSSGTRLGVYEVVAPIGAGGMGEVYRARDTRLGRDVAIKILPPDVAGDPERLARFEREAQVLASLNHPNIAHIHGVEESTGTLALVMELVEGPTLADRTAKGPLPVDEALAIARQIAEGIEAAHEQGIIHRDLKPANIKVRDDGAVKILDFGLAKAFEPKQPSAVNATQSPTITTPAMMTGIGVILGTAAYMSPEQAKGRPADKRSDIWAFGCVLYEMLTGKRAFEGEDVSETLAFILTQQPDWTSLPATTPPTIHRLLRRCLEKDRKRRLADAGDARLEIDEATSPLDHSSLSSPTNGISRSSPRQRVPIAAAAVAASILTAIAMVWVLRQAPMERTPIRFTIPLPEYQRLGTGRSTLAISPDGGTVVIAENEQLYLRRLSESESHPIAGSQAADTQGVREVTTPVFSPDGRFIAFASGQTIKSIPTTGGAAITVCEAGAGIFGMSWEGDAILFGRGSGASAGRTGGGILRVPASGGTPETLVSVSADEVAHGPQLLPGGRQVLFTLATGTDDDRWDRAKIIVQDITSGARSVLVDGGSDARYVPTGHLTYARGGVLYAIAFDIRRLATNGSAIPLVEGVRRANVASNSGTAHYQFSNNGSLVYVPGSPTLGRIVAFVDRKGTVEPLRLPERAYESPRLSADGKQLAVATDDGREAIVWIHDLLLAGSLRRLTLRQRSRFPIWTADGTSVAFQSQDDGDAIFWQRADGSGAAERLTKPNPGEAHIPNSWSPAGDTLLFTVVKDANASLWTLSVKDRTIRPVADVESTGWPNAVFSPDGRWVAYSVSGISVSDADRQRSAPGRRRGVFVQPFPPNGTVYPVATGALFPLWSRDGKELLFTLPQQGGGFSAVSITTTSGFSFGTPSLLARRELITPRGGDRAARNWDIDTNAQRLIGIVDARTQGTPQIQVVLNWFEELKQRVPVK